MKRESGAGSAWLIALLAVSVIVALMALLGFGYRATRKWQQSSRLLMTLNTKEISDLLVTSVTRDMGAVQSRILANRDWLEPGASLADKSSQVAVAFTRYPYPESFFTWNAAEPDVVFFNRVNRYPKWMTDSSASRPFPVILVRNPLIAAEVRTRVDAYGAGRFQYVALNMDLEDEPYQIIARLIYSDESQERPQSVIGFTVNLGWVRGSYFGELLSQVALDGANVHVGIIDDKDQLAWGTQDGHAEIVREFPLLFLNPSLGSVALAPSPSPPMWKIRAGRSRESPGMSESRQTGEAVLLTGSASVALFVALIIAVRAVQADNRMAALRSDFVSSVTHSLKMPLANISVIADTLALRPATGETVQKYANLLRQDSRRLNRLIDNLLAHARVTDVADLYSFHPIGVAKIIRDVVQGFRLPLSERNLVLRIEVPENLPAVHADRAAIMLALSNLLDNAIQYSRDGGSVSLTATHESSLVVIEVRDSGVGIPEDELEAVQRKFVRGRLAHPGGAGIGLSIVSRILKQHRGTFELKSRLGVETVARIGIPVA